ncbi:heptaprenyl diphosphate synthase component 1 [Sporolactobacillus nakayamae]|uniref:Heptaprenyl diphosphate synthase (HEPPP synthase) subunit 1 n=1 Tax=Sporolactobacillus nakayamae TaxID=269670 RepID=A0A1I2MWK8_9BACL|nr:heptaprenyl diphosphate synthase component 1 [Sporolactobacillus nakayamae]SFF95488.1 Heptaprenyl diphosphate synthase (HEPPP synthase) subunit 1 [Sporolactobacillus nakayamae]
MALNEELELVYHQLRSELNHTYVQTILPEPTIDRDKLAIYYLLFRHQETKESAAACAKSVMVAEIGLDTHESMTIEKQVDKDLIKKRQLTVLSGDFYSALYYYSLARQSKLEVVKWVAQAIQSFNVRKCSFFYSTSHLGWAEIIESVKKIESALVEKIACQLGLIHAVPLLNDFFLIKRLIFEKKSQAELGQLSYFSQKLVDGVENVSDKLDQEIKHKVACLSMALDQSAKHSGMFPQVVNYLHARLITLAEGFEERTY